MDVYCLLWRNPHFFSSISRKSPFFVCHLSAFPEKRWETRASETSFLTHDKLGTITAFFCRQGAQQKGLIFMHNSCLEMEKTTSKKEAHFKIETFFQFHWNSFDANLWPPRLVWWQLKTHRAKPVKKVKRNSKNEHKKLIDDLSTIIIKKNRNLSYCVSWNTS